MMESLEEATTTTTTTTTTPIGYTKQQLLVGMWATRITGIILLCCSLCVLWRAWCLRRIGIFHRLVIGMYFHLSVFGAALAIGAAAVPSQTTNAVGNLGTIATCTAQGFITYVTFLAAVIYCGSLSIYSCLGVPKNFQRSGVFRVWMEICVHALVHVYPVCSGVYLIATESFNNSGFGRCFLENDPIGCGTSGTATEDYLPCVRGGGGTAYRGARSVVVEPQRQQQLLLLLWGVPLYLGMLVPAAAMITLCRTVRRHQSEIRIRAGLVAKQASLYLLVLCVGVLPRAVVDTLEWFGSQPITATATETAFALNVFADTTVALFGLMSTLCYLGLTHRRHPRSVDENGDGDCNGNGNGNGNGENPETIFGDVTTNTNAAGSQRRKSTWKKSRFSFNIFDGTSAHGAFANYIHEGDVEDEQNDQEETDKWQTIQKSLHSV